ncbi:MAG TPA: zf-HC2 domain-containing protein [Candidatus Nanopelagicaceae bacterium]|nr:zf-HC2 domain-containing protein [Candidatus Nanopelagicaceae bacterium]
MKCSLLTLSCALDGELSKERQAELESHLVTCERCRTGMRYLREETERISQLVKVTVPAGTATALLERAKVIASVQPASEGAVIPPKDGPTETDRRLVEPGPDPFNLMGIGSQPIEIPEPDLTSPARPEGSPAEAIPPTDAAPAVSDLELFRRVPELDLPPTPSPSAPDLAMGPLPETPGALPQDWLIAVSGTPQGTRSDTPEMATGTSGAPPQVRDGAEPAAGAVPGNDLRQGPAEESGQTPVFMPLPAAFPDDADESGPPSERMSADGAPAPDPAAFPPGESDEIPGDGWADSGPEQSTPDRVEMMQVALEESAILDSDATDSHVPPSQPAEARASIPPPPSILKAQETGWRPNADLNLGLDDITAAKPHLDALASSADPDSPPKGASFTAAGPRPTPSHFTPVRPAAAAAAGTADRAAPPPSRRASEPRRRGQESREGKPPLARGTATPRSWTKTATIAIAALAVFLIGWTLTHHATTTPTHSTHVTSPAGSKPTPATSPKAPPSTAPAITLSGTQSFGSSGSGYQVQNARYGLHQNGTQLWVVFQLGSGSGPPHVTTGFDGGQTLYVEMQGVAAGTAVAQPPSGELVTSVQPGQVPGFSGAVYVLRLSRAAQVSGYLLPGSPTGAAGERVVLQLQ